MRGSTLAGVGAAARAAPPQRANRSARRWLGPTTSLALTLVVLGAAWWLLAPQQLGGSTAFVVVDGTSMLPHLHRSDLVVLRRSSSPRVGDVVGYRSALLHRVVLHRVVAIKGDRYVFKGDNNTFTDPERLGRADIIGRAWFHVPSAGRAIGVLHVPWVLAMLAALLVLAVGLGGSDMGSRDESEAIPL